MHPCSEEPSELQLDRNLCVTLPTKVLLQKYGLRFLTSTTWDVNKGQFDVLPEIWSTLYSTLLALILGGFFGVAIAILVALENRVGLLSGIAERDVVSVHYPLFHDPGIQYERRSQYASFTLLERAVPWLRR